MAQRQNMTQAQMYYAAFKKSAELNQAFMEHVRDGMTKKELEILIAKRPDVYGRFKGFLDKLP